MRRRDASYRYKRRQVNNRIYGEDRMITYKGVFKEFIAAKRNLKETYPKKKYLSMVTLMYAAFTLLTLVAVMVFILELFLLPFKLVLYGGKRIIGALKNYDHVYFQGVQQMRNLSSPKFEIVLIISPGDVTSSGIMSHTLWFLVKDNRNLRKESEFDITYGGTQTIDDASRFQLLGSGDRDLFSGYQSYFLLYVGGSKYPNIQVFFDMNRNNVLVGPHTKKAGVFKIPLEKFSKAPFAVQIRGSSSSASVITPIDMSFSTYYSDSLPFHLLPPFHAERCYAIQEYDDIQ